MTNILRVMKNVIEVNGTNFETEVLQTTGPVLVDFYAPWCGPCKMLTPLLEGLSGEFAGRVKFAKANVDENPELAACFEISAVPTLLLFSHGQVVDQIRGFPGPGPLKAWLQKAAGSAMPA
jgi:thioredoxin 1